MIDRDVIELQQIQILDAIFKKGKSIQQSEFTTPLKKIKSFHPSIVVGTFGSVGQKLIRFCDSIDLNHPDILNLCDGAFAGNSEGSFVSTMINILDVKEFCEANGICSYIKDRVSVMIFDHPSWKSVCDSIDDPSLNLRNVRFVKTRKQRDKIRSLKDLQNIYLRQIVKEQKDIFLIDSCHDSFEFFVRGKNIYDRDIVEAKSRIDHMKKFRLNSMVEEIERYLQELYTKMNEEMCFDFNSINLPMAAIILGKQVGVKFSVSSDVCGFIQLKSSISDTEYTPRAYPLNVFWKNTSKRVKQVVDYLEKFPELGKKPVFDHYRVVVPLPIEDIGVLLGEKEGRHYFVCYWEPANGD